MKKKIALFAISIFMLGTVSSVNAETKATDRCISVTFSCGITGGVCGSGDLIHDALVIDSIIC